MIFSVACFKNSSPFYIALIYFVHGNHNIKLQEKVGRPIGYDVG